MGRKRKSAAEYELDLSKLKQNYRMEGFDFHLKYNTKVISFHII